MSPSFGPSKTIKATPAASKAPAPVSPTQSPGLMTGLATPTTTVAKARLDPRLLTPAHVLQLQRLAGNRAVTKLHLAQRASPVVQPKLMVGAANDAHEREADRMASRVVNTPAPVAAAPTESTGSVVHRAAESDEDDEIRTREIDATDSFEVDSSFEDRLTSARSGGEPLPTELLAHELTHTIPQTGGVQRAPLVQRFIEVAQHPGVKSSQGGSLVFEGPKALYATIASINQAALALAAPNVGAVVTVIPTNDTSHFLGGPQPNTEYTKVGLAINAAAVAGALWQRMHQKQPGAGQGFRTFADCFRTSATVSGINPSLQNQREELRLLTGVVPVMTPQQAGEQGIGRETASRAAASFFQHAFPHFLGMLTAPGQPAPTPAVVQIIARLTGWVNPKTAQLIYKLILADAPSRLLFTTTFGINESMAPAIGTALTQVADPTEKAAAEGQGLTKWNFHWAGVIMRDGADYVTLENCAVEINEATAEELQFNAELFASKFQSKQDLLNNRWYFKLYGPAGQSFHNENLASPHATPSAITLPVGRG